MELRRAGFGLWLNGNKRKRFGEGAGDEPTELEVNLTSSHSSMETFSKAGEERLAAQGTLGDAGSGGGGVGRGTAGVGGR